MDKQIQPAIAQTLCVGTIEAQLRFATNVAQELLEQRDALVAALTEATRRIDAYKEWLERAAVASIRLTANEREILNDARQQLPELRAALAKVQS